MGPWSLHPRRSASTSLFHRASRGRDSLFEVAKDSWVIGLSTSREGSLRCSASLSFFCKDWIREKYFSTFSSSLFTYVYKEDSNLSHFERTSSNSAKVEINSPDIMTISYSKGLMNSTT
jgi:hypothetical protein